MRLVRTTLPDSASCWEEQRQSWSRDLCGRVRGREHAIKYTCPPTHSPLIPQSYKRRLLHSALSLVKVIEAAQRCNINKHKTAKGQKMKDEAEKCNPHCLRSVNLPWGVWFNLLCLPRCCCSRCCTRPSFKGSNNRRQNHRKHCLPQDWLTFSWLDVWLLDELVKFAIDYCWHGTINAVSIFPLVIMVKACFDEVGSWRWSGEETPVAELEPKPPLGNFGF